MADPAPRPSSAERRKNQRLRELVDEMLASIRVAANRELWTDEERAQYEEELAVIMARVRHQATAGPDRDDAGGGETPGKPRRVS